MKNWTFSTKFSIIFNYFLNLQFLTNRFKYNPPEHEVVAMAKRLKEVFEKKMVEVFSGVNETEEHESSSDFGDSDSDDERTRKLQAIQKKVSRIQRYFSSFF